jgi:aquaporin Z
MKNRPLIAEALGTALLVFVGCGTATLTFGFGAAGSSIASGITVTSLAFGLVLLVLVYAIGPISGCHVNPAVTIGFLVARRITLADAIGYWIAQFAGGIAGAALLYGIFHLSSRYTKAVGLGANGFGASSLIGANAGGAFLTEAVLTFLFVFVILAVTRGTGNAATAGIVIGLALALANVMAIPIDGTSVNPARSLAPAVFVGGTSLSQVWLFLIAPPVGGVLSAAVYALLYPAGEKQANRG